MPLELSWLIEGRVILSRSYGIVEDSEIPTIDQKIITMLETAAAPSLHIVTDNQEQTSPPNLRLMAAMKYPRHKKLDWMVSIGQINPFQRFLISTASRIVGNKLRFVTDLESGLAFLRETDPTLPADSAKSVQVN